MAPPSPSAHALPRAPAPYAGRFYCGDSYIVLATTARARGGALDYALHFWLGEATSQDEAGVAAFKTVELDQKLGDAARQHRETQVRGRGGWGGGKELTTARPQGHEGPLFLSYFRDTGARMPIYVSE